MGFYNNLQKVESQIIYKYRSKEANGHKLDSQRWLKLSMHVAHELYF
jgi:hypothetical protein